MTNEDIRKFTNKNGVFIPYKLWENLHAYEGVKGLKKEGVKIPTAPAMVLYGALKSAGYTPYFETKFD